MSEKRGIAERFLTGYVEQRHLMEINSAQIGTKYRAANVAAFVSLVGGYIPSLLARTWIAGKWAVGGMEGDPIAEIAREGRHHAYTRPNGRVFHLKNRP